MFEDNQLVKDVRNADPLLLNDLIHALCHRFDEISPDQTLLFFSVDKKRDFNEQADEFIRFMEKIKIKDTEKKRK